LYWIAKGLLYHATDDNIHNSSISEYSTTDTSNFSVDKYYVKKKNIWYSYH
jgi:hypothetical protein